MAEFNLVSYKAIISGESWWIMWSRWWAYPAMLLQFQDITERVLEGLGFILKFNLVAVPPIAPGADHALRRDVLEPRR